MYMNLSPICLPFFWLSFNSDDISTVKKSQSGKEHIHIFRTFFTMHTCIRTDVFIHHLQVQYVYFVCLMRMFSADEKGVPGSIIYRTGNNS